MRKSAFLLAGAAMLALSIATSRPAEAGWHLDNVDYFDDEGDWVEFWSDDEGHILIFVIEDGETIHYIADGFDNPNPEDGSGSEENLDHLQDILKKHGGGLQRLTNIAGTPLGHALLRSGGLIDPYHNPGDIGFEDGGGFGGGRGGGITPGNGSPTEQLKRRLGKGHEDGDDDDDDGDKTIVGLFDDDMPGPPEIVNPNPAAANNWEREGGNGAGGARSGGSPGGGSGSGGGGGGAAGAR